MRKIIIIILLILLLLCSSCYLFTREPRIPDQLEIDEIDILGFGPYDWVEPNTFYFIDSLEYPELISYNLDTGEVKVIDVPDLGNYPEIGIHPNGNYIGYYNRSGRISIFDLENDILLREIDGFDISFSYSEEKFVLWGSEGLYLMNISNSDEILVYEYSEEFWEYQTSWRPGHDQVTIEVVHKDGNEMEEIILVDLNSLDVRSVVKNRDALSFDWSPDGELLAYSYGKRLVILNFEQDCVVAEIQRSHRIYPLWSPDGTEIFLALMEDDIDILSLEEIFGENIEDPLCLE